MAVPKVKIVYNRRKTASNTKKASLEIEINFDKKQKFFSTGILLFPKEWNEGDKCIKGANAVQGNKDLDLIVFKVKSILNEMVENGNVNLDAVPTILKGRMINKTFIDFIRERIDDRNVRPATRISYEHWYPLFKSFGKIKYFSDITSANIIRYDEYLHKLKNHRDGKDLAQSTIKNYHRKLQTFIEDAVIFGHITDNPYIKDRIKIDSGKKDSTDFLTLSQLQEIEKLLLTGKMEIAKDAFLFQAYTGMAYIDCCAFDKNKVIETEVGKVYVANRVKTGQKFTLLLMEKALKILDKYNWNIPWPSNVVFNTRLKVIGAMIGVPKLHSHQARGTFATVALNNGINFEVLRLMMGHSNTKMTQHYASMLDATVISEMKTKLS